MKKRNMLILVVLMAAVFAYGQTVIGYTSFEEPTTVPSTYYTDSNTSDHALSNNDGQPSVVYTSVGGEMGFSAYFTNTLDDVGLSDGDYIGVTDYKPSADPFPDGVQAYQLSDCDGKVTVTLDPITLSGATTVYFSTKYFVRDDGWESADFIRIWLTIDGSDVDLLNTNGSDIDDLGIEGAWTTLSYEANASSSIIFHFELQSNAGYEALYIDDVVFTTGGAVPNPPIAKAGADIMAETGSTVTLDGSGSSDIDDNIQSYEWEMIWGTQVSPTLTGANTAVCTFTAPITPQDFRFILTVTDSTGLSDVDTVEVAIREPQESKLIISEYIEGSSNNKAIELYNLDPNSVNLSGYKIKVASNGEGWASYELELSGTLEGNGVYVIGNPSDNPSPDPAILNAADTTSTVTYYNGNDAVGLFLNDVLVDIIGNPTEALTNGTGWTVAGTTNATLEHTLIRKAYVETANPNWASSAGFDADNSEWIVYEQNYFSDLGRHTAGPVAYSFSNSTVITTFPQAGSDITIAVDITPDEGVSAPSVVKVWYGFDGTQPNSVDMWQESGNTYNGIIPSLAQGNKVLGYYIAATGTDGTVESNLYSMTVAGTLTDISDIHTNIATYDDQIKTIEGVITIGAGILRNDYTSCYIQDESGKGLNLYDNSVLLSDLARGTKVKLVGKVVLYYSTIEMTDFDYIIVSTGNELPAANPVNVAGANSSDHEGTLTTVTGTLAEVVDYSTSKNMILSDGTNSAIVKVWPTTGIDPASYTVGNDYSITGVGSQYSSEYQLLVGYATDITPYTGICEGCLPTEFSLNQAYPNPFNPATTIEFSLVEASDFNISVYNIAGQRVDVLASGYAEPGVYKETWHAGDFTSGVYFIRLEAGQNVATQKVVLIK